MAEETMQPAQEAPVPEAPIPAVPAAAASAAPDAPPRKGSPLLVFLTVLLILVGIADVVLWGVVGYYAIQNYQSGSGGDSVQVTGFAGGVDSGTEMQDALAVYIQEMEGI